MMQGLALELKLVISCIQSRISICHLLLVFCCMTYLQNINLIADGCIAGGLAGVMVETALYPIDTIKTRLQVSHMYTL